MSHNNASLCFYLFLYLFSYGAYVKVGNVCNAKKKNESRTLKHDRDRWNYTWFNDGVGAVHLSYVEASQ